MLLNTRPEQDPYIWTIWNSYRDHANTELVMTFLAPAKSINLVLFPLHLRVARKPDPLQPHQTPCAVTHTVPCTGNQSSSSLFSPPSSTWEDVKEILLVAKPRCFCPQCITGCCVTSYLISQALFCSACHLLQGLLWRLGKNTHISTSGVLILILHCYKWHFKALNKEYSGHNTRTQWCFDLVQLFTCKTSWYLQFFRDSISFCVFK